MKIININSLAIPAIKIVRFARFGDHRGYFTETFRKSDLFNRPEIPALTNVTFAQANESFSKKGVIRGLHFQWNPYMGKLVRTISGRMVDLVLDIRPGSPTSGKIVAYDMPAQPEADWAEWIWVPPGFAHGNLFTANTIIEYFCTGEYSPGFEAGISPLAPDIDWSLCDPQLKQEFEAAVAATPLITAKDKHGLSMADWLVDERSENFLYEQLT